MVLLSLLFAVGAVAAPASNLVLHEKRALSRLEGRSQRIDPNAILPIRIALRESNLDEGYDHLLSVSDPKSESYGKHWSIDEIHSYFAPSDETVEAVKAWLESTGISRGDILESTSKSWVGVDISAADAERLFGTEYYEHYDSDNNVDVGCDRYHVPSHLSHHIDYVKPGIMVSSFRKRTIHKRRSKRDEPNSLAQWGRNHSGYHGGGLASCGDAITPACIKALYDIPDATLNQPENAIGVFEYFDIYDQEDLDLYFAKYAPYVPRGTHPELVAIGDVSAPTSVDNDPGSESIVDFDLVFSLTYPQSVVLYQAQPTDQELENWAVGSPGSKDHKSSLAVYRGLFEVLLDAVDGSFCSQADRDAGAECGTVELTRVLSTSYSAPELSLPEKVTRKACNAFMKLGLKGHSLFFSSGDYGPGFADGCVNPNHVGNVEDFNGTIFNPLFPAACPFVTTVGATQLNHGQTVNDPETALYQPSQSKSRYSIFGSGGGFSNYFTMPGYQEAAVNTYLTEHDPGYPTYVYAGKDSVGAGGGKYAKGGRGFPDVSANGANLPNFLGGPGTDTPSYGTSLSTPIWASLITLVNQQRTLAGKGPVGFINPVLYAHPEIFTDITLGFAPGCLTRGFACVPGWDPVTGLGTPSYPKLLEVFMALP